MTTLIRQIKMSALMRTQADPAKADFIFAHPFLLEKSSTLNSPKFASKAMSHTYFKVIFRVSDASRVILTMMPLDNGLIENFVQNNRDQLVKESFNFQKAVLSYGMTFSAHFNDQLKRYESKIGSTSPDAPEVGEPEAEKIETFSLKAGIRKVSEGYWLNNTFVDNTNYSAFDMSLHVTNSEPVNILMIGPSGYGKTSIPEAFAQIHEMDFFRMNCAQVRDPEEWFGYREARDGNTVFIPSDFTKAVTKGNCVVVLDEFNRVEPWLHNTLYPLLDHARETSVHGETIKVGKNVIFVATANVGYQYVGSFQLDTAITNRMDLTLKVTPLPKEVEVDLLMAKCQLDRGDSLKIVRIVTILRDLANESKLSGDVSTRTSLKIAKFVKAVGREQLGDIVRAVVFNSLNPQELKVAIDAVAHLF